MRGVVSAAMITALEDLGLTDAFDAVLGASSGSVNGIHGATIRGGLVRAFLAAERIELVAKAEGNGSAATPAPPRQVQPVASGAPREG
jgi:hypothetical protein